jgi:hypoxanthine phosphoribosyltransferase
MKILFDEAAIRKRVAEMGREIGGFYGDGLVTLVVLANGALIFGADLARSLTCPVEWDVISVASYSGDRSSGKVNFRGAPKLDPAGRRILLADEVLDTGLTLAAVKKYYLDRGAEEVKTAVMVEKSRPRPAGALEHADWTGVTLPDRYLVGYGLDSHEKHRNLPHVAALD